MGQPWEYAGSRGHQGYAIRHSPATLSIAYLAVSGLRLPPDPDPDP